MVKSINRISMLFFSVVAVELCAIFALANAGKTLVFDEPAYVGIVPLVWKYGLSKQFFLTLLGPGPLYSWIQAFFAPLTALTLPGVRLVSLFLLMLTIAGLAWMSRVLNYDSIWERAFSIMSLPSIYVISGLALTNIPAVALCSIALALTFCSFQEPGSRGWFVGILAGVCWAGVLLGRQTYLPALLALIILVAQESKLWAKVLTIIIIGILPFLFLARTWGGFVAPILIANFRGLNFANVVMAMAYSGISIAFLCPGLFMSQLRWAVVLYALGFVGNLVYPFIQIKPYFTIAQFLSYNLQKTYSFLAGGFITGMALATFFLLIYSAWQRRGERFYAYYNLALLGIMFSLIKAPFISGLYVISAAPFFILLTAPYMRFSGWLVLRTILGGAMGLASLAVYLFK